MTDLPSLRKRADALAADHAHARRAVASEKLALADARGRLAAAKEAQALLQAVAQDVQERAHHRIASVVTRCLRAVFGEESYDFVVRFERKRGRTEASLLLERDGLAVAPADAAGGGVVDVAAFALRLACLLLARPALRRLLVLDEPMKMLSREYRPRVRALIETLAAELAVQFILVTHAPDLACGKVVELE